MRAIDADRLLQVLEINFGHTGGADVMRQLIEAQPTLSPPNEPLPVLVNDEQGREYIDYICPRCKGIISQRRRGQRMETVYQCKFHDNCGQRVDWENQQSYLRYALYNASAGLCFPKISEGPGEIPASPHPLPRFEAQLRHDHAVLGLLAEGHSDLAGAQQLQFYRRHLHPLSPGGAPADGVHSGGKSARLAGVDPNS